ncbi:MAG: CoA-binding protein [Bacteroidota bacterium]|jgi:predicted CoA-binding protein|nr:CoA-binding protein [Cytophagales bacterium]MCE2958956.1 CoA-binding protein [Flammeovirgaceae bacterium]MCZ8070832.1 CoA-binding protein [Cytophagales bacterium]
MKKTVIIGATTNKDRYAYLAAEMLTEYHHEIVPVGIKKGEVFGKAILEIQTRPEVQDVDTVTMYIGPQHQPEHYQYILSLKPKRVIFNPGTENNEFEKMVEQSGAEAIEACTLVMLRSRQY